MKSIIIKGLLKILFHPSPEIKVNKQEEQLFNDLFKSSSNKPDKLIEYNLPIPKYKFLSYLAQHQSIVFHGSNNKQIEKFEPRPQTLYDGKMATAVFATKDPIWTMFYAVLNKDKVVHNIRNGSISTDGEQTFHFYSLTKPTFTNNPWTSGMIYLLPEDTFTHIGKGVIQFSEWISENEVSPIAKIEVEPRDFYFLNKVATHQPNESVLKSWLLYKSRLFFMKKPTN
ncbi:hypothetical protein [Pseudoneobacillus sp. C159]